MQANQRVYRLAAVGRLLLTDCCSAMRDLPLSKRPERAILDSQPPGIGGMSVEKPESSQMAATSFVEFYRTIGLSEYPFALHTAESEARKHDEAGLFIRPTHYGPIFPTYDAGASMFLIGDRGVGKTALTYDFVRTATSKAALAVILDDFSSIKINYQPVDLYHLIAQAIVAKIFQLLKSSPAFLSRFTADERVFISYLRQQFFKPETKEQLDEELKKLQFPMWKRVLSSCWQWIRFPLNLITTISANLIGHTVSKSMGQDFPEIHMNEIKRIFPDLPFKTNSSYYDIKCNLNLIQKITNVVTKLGKTRTVVILDRLDEDSRLGGGDAEKVAGFVEAVVKDHNLLLGGMSLQVIVCLWSVPFYLLEHRGIRPQKINTEKLLWDRADLENALDTRLRYYSRNNIISWRAVFESGVSEGTFDDIFFVANGNPRNLWQIFDKVFREQHKRASQRTKLTERAAKGGLEEFVRTYRYFENYPRKPRMSSKKADAYTYIHELLKLDNTSFTRQDLVSQVNVGGSVADEHIKEMETIGLIVPDGTREGQTSYRIADPKIEFAHWNKLQPARAF